MMIHRFNIQSIAHYQEIDVTIVRILKHNGGIYDWNLKYTTLFSKSINFRNLTRS